MAWLFGENRDIFFPKGEEELGLVGFDVLAGRFLERLGYEAYVCQSEEEARGRASKPGGEVALLLLPERHHG